MTQDDSHSRIKVKCDFYPYSITCIWDEPGEVGINVDINLSLLTRSPALNISVQDTRGEREFPFPAIFGNTGLPFPPRKSVTEFSICILVPKIWEWNFPIPKWN